MVLTNPFFHGNLESPADYVINSSLSSQRNGLIELDD